MTTFFNILKKIPCFQLIFHPFSQFWGQKKIFWKIWLCHAQLHMDFQHHAKTQKKLMIQFEENTWTIGRKDRQALFHRALMATARSPRNQLLSFSEFLPACKRSVYSFLSSYIQFSITSIQKNFNQLLIFAHLY